MRPQPPKEDVMLSKLLGIAATTFAVIVTTTGTAVANGHRQEHGLIVAARFSAQNNGNPQVVAVRPEDGHVRILTSGSRDLLPDLSPDGQTVVFERCLHAVNCDQIGADNIWSMRADGSHPHPLTACDGAKCLGAFDPAFSPDGRFIAFAEDLLDANGVNFNGIFVMRADGSHVRRMTSNGPDNLPDSQPQFSHDGKQLVFQREVPGASRLMIVRTDGSGLRPLLPGVDASAPSWAPDGRRVAFTLAVHTGNSTTFNVATVHPDGTDLRLLTNTSAANAAFAPDYSPGGQRIVFSQSDADGCHLVIGSVTGQHPRTLPTGPGCLVDASWGPSRS
jgi:Tol biopolymer transport system component